MSQGQPRLLFLTLSDDIGSERIVSEMGRRGAVCAVLGRRDAIAARSVHVSQHHRLPSFGGLWWAARAVPRRLSRIVGDWCPDAVIPLDDMAAQVLRDLAVRSGTEPAVRHLLQSSLGDPAHYPTALSRALLIEAAAALGVVTPGQRRVADVGEAEAAAEALGYPLMLKRQGTCGGCGVALVRDRADLVRAFRGADRRARVKRAIQALIGLRPVQAGAALTLQAHVSGALAIRTVACEAGRVLAGVNFVADQLDPPVTGSSTVIRHLDHPGMERAAERLVAALGCSGFVSFDFILSPAGSAHLIEMNARPVGSGHLGHRFGHDVYGTWLRRFPGFRDLDQAAPAGERPSAVALFPKEMGRDPTGQTLRPEAGIVHDVPWDEPRVVADYRERLMRRHPADAAAIGRRLGGVEAGERRPTSRALPLKGLWT